MKQKISWKYSVMFRFKLPLLVLTALVLQGCTERNPSVEHGSLEGVWDFITDAKLMDSGHIEYIRGTLYVKQEDGKTECSLKAFDTKVNGISAEDISAAEQKCQIFEDGKDISINSSVTKGENSYLADDFRLRRATDTILVGELKSSVDLSVTFAKRGFGHEFAKPLLWRERQQLQQLVVEQGYIFLAHGDTGCAFGRTGTKEFDEYPGGFAVETIRICRVGEQMSHVLSPSDEGGSKQGLFVDCKKRLLFTNWTMSLGKDLATVTTEYAGEDGTRHTVRNLNVPRPGEGQPTRISFPATPSTFKGEPLSPNSVFRPFFDEQCGAG
jgi:hypothetical protein